MVTREALEGPEDKDSEAAMAEVPPLTASVLLHYNKKLFGKSVQIFFVLQYIHLILQQKTSAVRIHNRRINASGGTSAKAATVV